MSTHDELELHGDMFRPDAGVPGPVGAGDEFSGAIDLTDLIEQVERGESDEQPPPSLADSPSLLWGVHSGLHSSLLSTASPMNTAEAWQALAEELAEESRHVEDAQLRAALMCEAGRILVERLGRQEEGQLLMRNSASPIAQTLLNLRTVGTDSLAAELAELESRGRNESLEPEQRAAAWVEFGLLCEENMANRERAIDAYQQALACVPGHPVALSLATDAAVILGYLDDARGYVHERLQGCQSPRMRLSLLLDLAECTEDPVKKRILVEQAHEAMPSEETALRRLIRLVSDTGENTYLGQLYRRLADTSEDPLSASTALHLAFLTLVEAGDEVDDLVRELAGWEAGIDGTDTLAPLSEVAMYIEQRVATGAAGGLPSNLGILERVARSLDAPREQALVREQMARIRMEQLRELEREAPTPADTVTGLPKLGEDRLALCAALEPDLRFCLVHLPEHRWVRMALADLLRMQGDIPGLVVHLQEWARTQSAGPGRAAILLRLGHVHESLRHDLPRAAEVYELAVAEDPDDANCLRALGRVYEKMRRWPQAVANLQRQARETDDGPERLAALRRVASMAQHELEDIDLAIASLEEVARLDPDDLLSLFQLAALARAGGRTPILVNTLQVLVERLDDDVARTAILVELGEVLELQLKRRDPALASYERALKLTPGYQPALRALARLYRDNQDMNSLLALHDPQLDSVTDPAMLALKAARICMDEMGDIERALEFLRTAYRTNPDLIPARELLLQLLTISGHIDEAYDLLRAQDFPAAAPLLADHHYRLGLLAEALARHQGEAPQGDAPLEHLDSALQHYRAAIAAQPEHGLASERSRRLLVAHHDHANLARLLREQEAATRDDPRSRTLVLTQLARLLAADGEGIEEARRSFEEASQASPGDPLVRHEFENLLRRTGDQQTLPALYLQSVRYTKDTHYRATLLVEAAELLIAGNKPEDRELAGRAILDALHADPGNPYAVRHLERLLSEPDPPLAATEAVGARAVRAQSDAERGIFYLESAELLESASAVDQARRAYQAALGALPHLAPAELGLQRLSQAPERGPAKVIEAKQPVSLHDLMAEARDAAVRAGAAGNAAEGHRAVEILAGILGRDPNHRDAIALGRALTSQLANPAIALDLLSDVFPQVTEPEVRYELAVLLGEHAPRLEDAADYLQEAVKAKPDGKQALRALVHCFRQMGRDSEAATATEKLLELYEPGEPSAIDLRMGIAAFLGRDTASLSRALDHARIVLRARPNEPRAIMLMVDLLERSKRRVEAAGILDRLLARERDRTKLHELQLRKAKLLATSAEHKVEALSAAERAAQLNPGHRETVGMLAALLEQSGQKERLKEFLGPIRGAMIRNIGRGAVALRDLRLLAQICRDVRPHLALVADSICHAIDPGSVPPPKEHLRTATRTGLRRVLGDASTRARLLAAGEHPALHELLTSVDSALPRLHGEFPMFSPDDAVPMPPGVDASTFQSLLQQWSALVGVPGAVPQSSTTNNGCFLILGTPPELRLGANLWMQGDPLAWRGLCAVALSRHALGAPAARALPAIEMDLLIAACFETSRVFNAITADPDPRRLREVTAALARHLPRRQRRAVEQAAEGMSALDFVPSATAKTTMATDLRLAALLTGDFGGTLSAACLLDGVAGGSLKHRINRSRLGQQLLAFVLSDDFLDLRALAYN